MVRPVRGRRRGGGRDPREAEPRSARQRPRKPRSGTHREIVRHMGSSRFKARYLYYYFTVRTSSTQCAPRAAPKRRDSGTAAHRDVERATWWWTHRSRAVERSVIPLIRVRAVTSPDSAEPDSSRVLLHLPVHRRHLISSSYIPASPFEDLTSPHRHRLLPSADCSHLPPRLLRGGIVDVVAASVVVEHPLPLRCAATRSMRGLLVRGGRAVLVWPTRATQCWACR